MDKSGSPSEPSAPARAAGVADILTIVSGGPAQPDLTRLMTTNSDGGAQAHLFDAPVARQSGVQSERQNAGNEITATFGAAIHQGAVPSPTVSLLKTE